MPPHHITFAIAFYWPSSLNKGFHIFQFGANDRFCDVIVDFFPHLFSLFSLPPPAPAFTSQVAPAPAAPPAIPGLAVPTDAQTSRAIRYVKDIETRVGELNTLY